MASISIFRRRLLWHRFVIKGTPREITIQSKFTEAIAGDIRKKLKVTLRVCWMNSIYRYTRNIVSVEWHVHRFRFDDYTSPFGWAILALVDDFAIRYSSSSYRGEKSVSQPLPSRWCIYDCNSNRRNTCSRFWDVELWRLFLERFFQCVLFLVKIEILPSGFLLEQIFNIFRNWACIMFW